MTTTGQLQISPIPVVIDNVADWAGIAREIASESGVPTVVTPELFVGMSGSAVALLFEADAANDMNLLRGTFADPVIAQCQRNCGCLQGEKPTSATVKLIGAHAVDGHPTMRARFAIQVHWAADDRTVNTQFWQKWVPGASAVPH